MPRHGATLNDLTRNGKVMSDKRRATCMKHARKVREQGLRRTYATLRNELINLMRLTNGEAAIVLVEGGNVFGNRQASPELTASDTLLHSVHRLLDHRGRRAQYYRALSDKILADIANRRMP